jgi:hypothetical protein
MATMTGFAFKRSLRHSNVGGLPEEFLGRAWAELDGGTKHAILRLYRSMPEDALARAGRSSVGPPGHSPSVVHARRRHGTPVLPRYHYFTN